MLQITATPFINYLQTLMPELTLLLTLAVCYTAIIIAVKFFQKDGLYIYSAISIIACNMQVLKAMEVSWYTHPIPLGTFLYSTTFLASDVITELYGAHAARKSVGLGFMSSIIMLVLMIFALGLKPLNIPYTSEHWHFNIAHEALTAIFLPHASIVISSLTAYVVSQLSDIFIFSKLKNSTHNKRLWLRVIISISVASFIDTTVFSTLAWVVFAPEPVSTKTLIFSYILSAYPIQMLVAILNIPAFYLLLKIVRK